LQKQVGLSNGSRSFDKSQAVGFALLSTRWPEGVRKGGADDCLMPYYYSVK